MRILLILIVLAAVGAAAFRFNANFREKVRGYQVSGGDKERFEAYKQGKSLFGATYKGAGHLDYRSWGDDEGENATLVSGSVWLARGIASQTDAEGTKTDLPWCMAFDRAKGTALAFESGAKATEALKNFDTRQETGSAPVSPSPLASPKATPTPGSWMWGKDGRSSLDQPAFKTHPH